MMFRLLKEEKNNFLKLFFFLLLVGLISSCSSSLDIKNPRRAQCKNFYEVGKYTGHYKIGSPYKVNNKIYIPKIDHNYEEVGIASWYGDLFQCRSTANGEVFNKNALTAAHKTLPLPSIVQVTNLENGKTIKVIVNDRGPFVNNRIIDLSEKAAMMIGIHQKGLAKVKVKLLQEDTHQLYAKLNLQRNKIKNNQLSTHYIAENKFKKPIKIADNKSFRNKQSNNQILFKEDYQEKLLGEFNNKKDALELIKRYSEKGYLKISQVLKDGKSIFQVHSTSALIP